jgi:hypothetical protein
MGIIRLIKDLDKSRCLDGVLPHQVVVICCVAAAQTSEQRGIVSMRAKDMKKSGENTVLAMDKEKTAQGLVEVGGLVLLLQRQQSFYLFTICEPPGVHFVASCLPRHISRSRIHKYNGTPAAFCLL